MATSATLQQTKWWTGGKSPFNMEYGKLMMWYFLMSDATPKPDSPRKQRLR